jgi:hypothetical protein
MFNTHQTIDISILSDIAGACYSQPNIKLESVRDAISDGQLYSKLWLIETLMNNTSKNDLNILIVGGWIALLAKLFYALDCSKNRINSIISLDIDPNCERFANALLHRENSSNNYKKFKAITYDMYNFDYSSINFDVVINTSCEHIPNIDDWLKKIPDEKLVVLQSNNYKIPEHINCVESIDEFKNKCKSLNKILYSRELNLKIYTRYMIIGIK